MSALTDYEEGQQRAGFFRTTAITVRANTTAYNAGDRVMLGTSDLNVYECITGGTTAGSPPAFNTTLGDTTTDGTVTWLACKIGALKRPIFVALYTAAPGETGGGTEVSGGSYARVAVPPLDANWSAASATDGVTDNVGAITFPAPTANWGVVTHFGISDRLTSGNPRLYGALAQAKTVNNGDAAPNFPAGSLDVTFA